jgi:transposase
MYFDNEKKKISVYPTPSNIESLQYKDKADNCYEYSMEKVKCPSNKSKINHIPVQ